MQQEDDLRALEKVVQCMRGISVIFLFSNIYWFGYEWFVCRGWTNAVVDDILRRFQAETGLFSHAVTTKLCALMLLAVGCYGTKSVRDNKVSGRRIALAAAAGALLFFGCDLARIVPGDLRLRFWGYVLTLAGGYLLLLAAGVWIGRRIGKPSVDDPFNEENESFMQETRLLENEYSVNLPTRFCYGGQSRTGWINVVNPFRATAVLGTPGSGKSYAVINSYIRQHIEKGFAMYIYDFKFDDLSTIAYNHLLRHLDKYEVKPRFCVINFDDPRRSNRCNPLDARFMTDISDAFESSYVILLNLNKTWAQKEGDFFSDSAIVLLAAIIWYLKIYDGGRYCTFPPRRPPSPA